MFRQNPCNVARNRIRPAGTDFLVHSRKLILGRVQSGRKQSGSFNMRYRKCSGAFAANRVQPTAELQILNEDKPVHSEPVAFRRDEVSGTYRIDQETAPGRYFMGITAEDAPGKKNGRATTQWIDFEVVK